MLKSFRDDAREAWLRLVQWIHTLAGSFLAALAAAYEARPDAVKQIVQQVPVWAYFIVAVPFFWIVSHALKKAKG